MVDRQKVAMEFKNGRGVGWEKTALGDRKCRGDFAEKAARGGKKRAQLFGGKLPLARKNSAGLDFVERKRNRPDKKRPQLLREKLHQAGHGTAELFREKQLCARQKP
ncbi:hypothetical protein T10_7845 [Trichinella papuae]|uniref:Uncharacterized protein n=1 Tax=Trichinella papuae TaxID=268474 RepID=A0A0V1M300_9BILA|nr:hypothetical protein T10_7845 [Trichinella papuae]